jgi:hypothetical protein
MDLGDLGQVIAHAKAPADSGLLACILAPPLASSRLPGGRNIGDPRPRLCALSLPADGTSPQGYPPTRSTPITIAVHSWHRLGLVLGQRLDPIGQEASQGPHNQMLTRSPAPTPPMLGCVTIHPRWWPLGCSTACGPTLMLCPFLLWSPPRWRGEDSPFSPLVRA